MGRLEGVAVSVRLWPDPPVTLFEAMTLLAVESGEGVVKLIALTARDTIVPVFAMDVAKGRVHTLLNGMRGGSRLPTKTSRTVRATASASSAISSSS
jgi:hypothetical protein